MTVPSMSGVVRPALDRPPPEPRPYKVIVLSGHGETQGPTFERTGPTLAALVAELL